MKPQPLTKPQKFVKHRYELACRRKAVARRDAKHEVNMATLKRIEADMKARRANLTEGTMNQPRPTSKPLVVYMPLHLLENVKVKWSLNTKIIPVAPTLYHEAMLGKSSGVVFKDAEAA